MTQLHQQSLIACHRGTQVVTDGAGHRHMHRYSQAEVWAHETHQYGHMHSYRGTVLRTSMYTGSHMDDKHSQGLHSFLGLRSITLFEVLLVPW